MAEKFIDIASISALHEYYRCGKPKHPLVTVIDLGETNPDRPPGEVFFRTAFYCISNKLFDGTLKYGRSYYDFDEGTLMFTSPHQVTSSSPGFQLKGGWGLFFHPDLINSTALGSKIGSYSFFQYDANEALHISEEESLILKNCIDRIKAEYSRNTDNHTKELILSNIELLLNYCNRFYDRQFLTRSKVNHDLVQRFETSLNNYFAQDTLIGKGLPDVKYFAGNLNLSPSYLSDLLKRHTGKTALEHIHLKMVDKARAMLWGTQSSISEIAYALGFEHPSHFTKLFKTKIGMTPTQYRNSN